MKALTVQAGKLQINFVMPAQFQEPETVYKEAEKVLLSSGTEIVLSTSSMCLVNAIVEHL